MASCAEMGTLIHAGRRGSIEVTLVDARHVGIDKARRYVGGHGVAARARRRRAEGGDCELVVAWWKEGSAMAPRSESHGSATPPGIGEQPGSRSPPPSAPVAESCGPAKTAMQSGHAVVARYRGGRFDAAAGRDLCARVRDDGGEVRLDAEDGDVQYTGDAVFGHRVGQGVLLSVERGTCAPASRPRPSSLASDGRLPGSAAPLECGE